MKKAINLLSAELAQNVVKVYNKRRFKINDVI